MGCACEIQWRHVGAGGPGVFAVPLLGDYAVVTLPESELETYVRRPQIEFVEIPKRLFLQIMRQIRQAVSLRSRQDEAGVGNRQSYGKRNSHRDCRFGRGLLASGFRNPDGTTRILRLWDQEISGNPPGGVCAGYRIHKRADRSGVDFTGREGANLYQVRT